jgi:hypothetical protein
MTYHRRYNYSNTTGVTSGAGTAYSSRAPKFEVIRIRKFVKEREHNGQKKKDKRTNNDLPNTTQKTKDREKRTQLKSGVNLGALEE